ncbi:uncharacterized protein LOC110029401 [Phalaenopsis equestris]|uniref:uncharacterized protein LOC110029401 n=1 Tax=Phalaenopsis equestris TaxID=78828 RepID=UPI0009E1B0E2|nr:uncharacterized protein LOC110029401 [Phalaenopsis equestris]
MDHPIVSELSPQAVISPVPLEFSNVEAIPHMNALEILRETARILRTDPSTFLTIMALLICPVSTALLSNFLVDKAIVTALGRRLMLLAVTNGLPATQFIKQICHHLAGTIVSSAFCFPLLITFLLLARACTAYSVACNYAGKKVIATEFMGMARRIWRSLVSTYILVCAAIVGCLAIFIVLIVVVCNSLAVLGYPPEIIVYPALVTVLGFSVAYAHTIIVCNIAIVISVLEDASGPMAFLRSVRLVKGQTQAGLLIFLGSAIGSAFVAGLFEHRVKTLSYGDGSSRIWEGPLLVLMYSFVLLVDSMMSAVFYFTCRSSGMEVLSGNALAVEELETLSSESATVG